MKKSILTAVICTALALSLAACSTGNPGSKPSATSDTSTAAEETTIETTDETTEAIPSDTTEATEITTETTEAPQGNGPDVTESESEATSESQETSMSDDAFITEDTIPDYAPAVVTVDEAGKLGIDKESGDYVNVSSGSNIDALGFKTDIEVTDFKILALEFVDVDSNGNPQFKASAVHTREALTPDRPLYVEVTFAGDIPNNGFMYKDTDGSEKIFSVSLSGMDGSVIVSPISIIQ